jgi:predicted dehydrogenase
VRIVGFSNPDLNEARALADRAVHEGAQSAPIPAFADHRELLRHTSPHALAIFTPHLNHYRPTMDALQADCHVFVEKPLSTNVQEAADIVGLARARGRKVAVGHQYRLLPSLVEARRRLSAGVIGRARLFSAVLAAPWLAEHAGSDDAWRLDSQVSGGGILADAGDHLLDALIWISGSSAVEAAAFQFRLESGLDLVTAAAVRLADASPATLAISGVSAGFLFEIQVLGERGRLRVTDRGLWQSIGDGPTEPILLSEQTESIDSNFVAALVSESPLCCSAEDALETVRLLEAITRSVATNQVVRLS